MLLETEGHTSPPICNGPGREICYDLLISSESTLYIFALLCIIILYELLEREREKVICLYLYVFNLLVSAQHLAKASSDEACGADGTWSKLLGPTSSVNDLVIYDDIW
jgi:hypothetical protein